MKRAGRKSMPGYWAVFSMAMILAATSGCATHQGRSVKTTGFLGDYSMLREGKGDEVLLIYTNPRTDFRRYNKILLDPVKIYPGEDDTLLGSISREDLQKQVDYLYAALREELGEKFTFVSQAGPGTMRIRIALTESESGKVVIDLVSSVIPIGIAISSLKSVATGKGSGVGAASVEFEAQDSLTGERLAAAVDRRIGNKYTLMFNKFSRWRATKGAINYWAKRMRVRLTELQRAPQ